jgi:plastocyanin
MRGSAVVMASSWLALIVAPSWAATVSGTAFIGNAPAAGAVVYLEGANEATGVTPGRAVMDQKNLMFFPRVLPIVRGTTVEFTNSDDLQHNVFSPSAIAGKFNLGAYGPGAERSVAFTEPGDVLVLCNIHMEMEAHILVLRDPYFALASEAGQFRIPDVPAGHYTARVWQNRFLSESHDVDVPPAGDVVLDLQYRD